MGQSNYPVFVISGSRRIRNYAVVADAITDAIERFGCKPVIIIEGGQRSYDSQGCIVGGADYFARVYAEIHDIPCDTYEAKWGKYGLAAGPIRNREMAQDADYLVAIPDEQSKGTVDMIKQMKEAGKEDRIYVA